MTLKDSAAHFGSSCLPFFCLWIFWACSRFLSDAPLDVPALIEP